MILLPIITLWTFANAACHDVCHKDKCMGTRTNPLERGVQYETVQDSYRRKGCCWWGSGACDLCCKDDGEEKFNPNVENRGDLTDEQARLSMEMGYLSKSLLDDFGGATLEGTTVNAQGAQWQCVKLIDGEDVLPVINHLLDWFNIKSDPVMDAGRAAWYENSERQMCAVNFRGSATWQDYVMNGIILSTCLDNPNDCDIRTHWGFQTYYNAYLVYNNAAEYETWLKSCSDRGYSITFGGQSLGGALATIAGWSLMRNVNPVRSWTYDTADIKIYTTGSPRVLHWDSPMCPRLLPNSVVRLVQMHNDDQRTDVVPMVVQGMSHCVGGYGIRKDGTSFWNHGQYFPKNRDYGLGLAWIHSLTKFNNWHTLAFEGGYLDRLILRVTGSDWRVTGGNIAVENGGRLMLFVKSLPVFSTAGLLLLGVMAVAAVVFALYPRKKTDTLIDDKVEYGSIAA